jgi:hypothetical protein
VRASFDSLPGKLEVIGVVRNCILLSGTRHRVGVEFKKVWRAGREDDAQPGHTDEDIEPPQTPPHSTNPHIRPTWP